MTKFWTHLAVWESKVLARKLIAERANLSGVDIEDSRLAEKGRGLAYCLRNAREHIRASHPSSISRIVSDYYGCMWLLSGIMIAKPDSKYDLQTLEERMKSGHGLANMTDDSATFPHNEYILLKQSGFFVSY